MLVSFDDEVTFVDLLQCNTQFLQTVLGSGHTLEVDKRMHVKGQLVNSTSPNLNANLIFKFIPRDEKPRL